MIVLLGLLLSASPVLTMAQGGPRGPRLTVEERLKRIVEKMTTELSLNTQQVKGITPIFKGFFTDMEKLREGGRPNPEDMKKVIDTRNSKLKGILSEAQMKKLKEIEEEMRKRRPDGPDRPE